MAPEDTVRSQTITKYRELNDQLRDFLKNVLLFEKSASSHQDNGSSTNDNGGISLLAVKNDLLLHYLINLVTVMQRRSSRQPTLTSPSTRSIILRLCEIRTFIEKLRPIEQKLHYQMDKLLRNNLDQQLNYRANVANFDEGENNDAQEANDDDEPIDKPKLYRPPKHVPVEFHDEIDHKNDGQKVDKRLEHLKRRAYHSDILDEYKAKYSDAPEEVFNSERSRLLQNNRAYKEKVAYEEDYMKRLPQTKKERIQMQRSMSTDGNDVLNHLQDASILFDDDYREGSSKKKTKGKVSRKGKKRLEKKKSKSIKRVKSRK